MSQPVLTYSLDWGNNTAQKLSGKTFTKPGGTVVDCSSVSVTFSSSVAFKKFYATSVKAGNDYGFINDILVDIRDTNPTGVLVHELTNRAADTDFTFTINTASHMTSGDGDYRIGMYVQQSDGTWNYEYFLLTCNSENVQLSNDDLLQVPVITD